MSRPESILIPGGGGFLGSFLVPMLRKSLPGTPLTVLGHCGLRAAEYARMGVTVVEGDLNSLDIWKKLPSEFSHVFYLAARIPGKEDDRMSPEMTKQNLLPVSNFLDVCRKWRNLKQVVLASSIAVYDWNQPVLTESSQTEKRDLYGLAKLETESMLAGLRPRGIKVASLRFSSLYGRGQREDTVLPAMVRNAREGAPIQVYGSGRRTQDFLHAEDAARALWLACQKEADRSFNIASGEAVSMRDLAALVNQVFAGGRAEILSCPEKEEGPSIRVDVSQALSELGFTAEIRLADGLAGLKEYQESMVR